MNRRLAALALTLWGAGASCFVLVHGLGGLALTLAFVHGAVLALAFGWWAGGSDAEDQ